MSVVAASSARWVSPAIILDQVSSPRPPKPKRSAQLGLPEADLEEAPSPDTEDDCPTLTSTEPGDPLSQNLRGLLKASPLLRNCIGICQRREDIVKILLFSNEENSDTVALSSICHVTIRFIYWLP